MASAWIQSVRVHVCSPETSTHFDAVSVAGLHHSAIFSWEIKAGGACSKQRGMDVIRYLFSTPFPSHFYDIFVHRRHNGGWVKVYRSSAAAAQLQVKLRVRALHFQHFSRRQTVCSSSAAVLSLRPLASMPHFLFLHISRC
jgi:hypothetical protein